MSPELAKRKRKRNLQVASSAVTMATMFLMLYFGNFWLMALAFVHGLWEHWEAYQRMSLRLDHDLEVAKDINDKLKQRLEDLRSKRNDQP